MIEEMSVLLGMGRPFCLRQQNGPVTMRAQIVLRYNQHPLRIKPHRKNNANSRYLAVDFFKFALYRSQQP